MKIEYIPIKDLKPVKYNPRKMTEKQAADLEQSFKKFGLVDPLIVNRHPDRMNIVIGGHQRLKIVKRLGIDKIPVVYVELDEEQERELNLRLNKNLGEWDVDLLADFDMDLLKNIGWEDEELTDIFQINPPNTNNTGSGKDVNALPSPPIEPESKLGDLFQLGRHRLLCGDSTKREDVERLMGGEQANMVFTSPPYTDQREYHIGSFSWDELMLSVFDNIISLVVNDTTHILVNLGPSHKNRAVDMYWNDWFKFMDNHGYPLFGWYVWDKGCGMPGDWSGMLAPTHEFIFHFNKKCDSANKWIETKYDCTMSESIDNCRKSFRKKNGKLISSPSSDKFGQTHKVPDSVIRISRASTGGTILTNHPAVFPVELPEFGCKTWTNEDDLVFEPFGGSGSTLIACERTNRQCFLMEIDPAYVDIVITRWEEYTGEKALHI